MSASGNSCFGRFIRRVWPGANPLRRRTDWFESVAFIVGVVAAIFAMVLATSVSQGVQRDEMEQIRAEEASRRQVSATVVTQLEDKRAHSDLVVVRWGKEDRESFGAADLNRPVQPGDTVVLWVDQHNRLVPEPSTPAAASQAAGMAGASVLIGCCIAAGLLYGCARWWVTRKRLAAWEAEWARVGPQWRRRTG